MLGMKNHFDISGSIEICEVDIAGVACSWKWFLYAWPTPDARTLCDPTFTVLNGGLRIVSCTVFKRGKCENLS